jgi:hypothetical protein
VQDKIELEVKALRQTIYHLAIQNKLLYDKNDSLIKALRAKKKQKKKSKALNLNKHNLNY